MRFTSLGRDWKADVHQLMANGSWPRVAAAAHKYSGVAPEDSQAVHHWLFSEEGGGGPTLAGLPRQEQLDALSDLLGVERRKT